MTENRRILLNIVATYGRSLYALVLGLVCGRWALMALGEIDFGLNGLVGCLTSFIAFFNGVLAGASSRFYAFSIGAVRTATDRDLALEECRRWFNTAFSVHLVVPFVLIVVGYPIGVCAIEHWLTIPPDRIVACLWVFRFVCISCFVGMVNVPFSAMYGAKQYIAELTVYGVVTSTLNVVFLHYMLTHPGDWLARYALWSCLLGVIPQIVICLRACAVFPECQIRWRYMWDVARLRRLGGFAGWQFLGVFCGLLRNQGMTIVVNKFFGAAMNAAQTIGNTVQGHCNSLAGAMQSAFVPVITQACGAGDYEKMNRFALRTCKFNVLLSVVFMLPLALELPEVLRLWLVRPPVFVNGLCYLAMLYHLAGSCTVGHVVAINATGRIALYHVVMSTVSIFTIPFAVLTGLLSRNVYAVMSVVVFMEVLNSIGRIVFARRITGLSVRSWSLGVALPLAATIVVVGLLGWLPRLFMIPSFLRVCVTTLLCESAMLPLSWFVVLTIDERMFVVDKLRAKFKRLFGR